MPAKRTKRNIKKPLRKALRKPAKSAKSMRKAARTTSRRKAGRKISKKDVPGYLRNINFSRDAELPTLSPKESIQLLERGHMPKKNKVGENFKGKNRVIIT